MDVRIRLPELMAERGLTAYAIAKASNGRISMSTAYRLAQSEGRMEYFEAKTLDALCDVFGVGPGELLEREKPKRR